MTASLQFISHVPGGASILQHHVQQPTMGIIMAAMAPQIAHVASSWERVRVGRRVISSVSIDEEQIDMKVGAGTLAGMPPSYSS